MDREKTIDVLNTLITINNDRIEGYETASKEAKEHDLKALFSQFSNTSHSCKRELVAEVNKLGGTPSEGTNTTGKIYRAWMDIKAALTGNDRKAILSSCEYGEDVAVGTYKDALSDHVSELSAEHQSMLHSQHALIKADHDKVKSMRDSIAAN